MKKNIFKLSLIYIFTFLLCSKIYSNEQKNLISEIRNLLEFSNTIDASIKSYYSKNLYQPFWQNNKIKTNEFINVLKKCPPRRYSNCKIWLKRYRKISFFFRI